MMVVPESIIVSKPETAAMALAPLACQNPVVLSTVWYSIEPVYVAKSVPSRKSSEPEEASLKPKTPEETKPDLMVPLN